MRTPVIRVRAVGVAALCLGLSVLAGACGSKAGSGSTATNTPSSNGIASKSAAQIIAATEKALESARSVHMRGTVSESGQRYTLDIVMTSSGGKGSMTGPMAGVKRAQFDFISVGSKAYIRSSTFWRQLGGATAASLLNNRWILMPSNSMTGFPFISTKSFIASLHSGNTGTAGPVGTATVVNGQPAIPVTSGDGIVYVATTGTPYPLRIRPASPSAGVGVVDFLDYNAPVAIAAPPNPVDLSKIRGGG